MPFGAEATCSDLQDGLGKEKKISDGGGENQTHPDALSPEGK